MERNEKVIFRTERNPYMPDTECYIAAFPDDETRYGRIGCVPFYFDGYGKAWFEPYTDVYDGYYYGKTRIIHKGTPQAEKCLSAIESYYGVKFDVVEHRR